jgi:hypothetical protein
VGLAEAQVNLKKIQAYGDPRLFTLNLVTEQLSHSQQPLVPQSLMMMGGQDGQGTMGNTSLAGGLISLLLAEKGGLKIAAGAPGSGGPAVGPSGDVGDAPQTPPQTPPVPPTERK